MISEKNIEKIFETLDIEDIISDFVTLKKRGSNLLGLCPFHNEKTPSFSVSPSKGIFKCFGCGKGGNAIQFLMEHENFTYPEALKYVAAKYNILIEEAPLTREAEEERKERDSLYIVNEFARKFFKESLLNTGEGKSVGLDYFNNRGYDQDTIDRFDLGYAPRSGTALKSAALRSGYELERLKTLGLVSAKEFDFFRERVIFTIHNLSGKPLAFAGRTLSTDKKTPKYVNSPESEIYVKSNILYGLYQARQTIRAQDRVYLVEGYTDVISLHQAGITNVVAVSGTSLTQGQINLLKRFSNNIHLIFDGDSAGMNAAMRSLDLLLEQQANVRTIMLPEGEDPDSIIKSIGKEAFLTFLEEQNKDFLDFKLSVLPEAQSEDPFERTKAIREIVRTISLLTDQLNRSLYIRKAADRFKMEESVLVDEVNKALKDKIWKEKGRRQREKEREERNEVQTSSNETEEGPIVSAKREAAIEQRDFFQERALIEVLLKYGNEKMENGQSVYEFAIANLEDIADNIEDKRVKAILQSMKASHSKKGALDIQSLVGHPDSGVNKLVVDLLTEEYSYSENWENRWNIILQNQKPPDENFTQETEQVVISLKLRKVRRVIDQLMKDINKKIEDQNPASVDEQLELYMELKSLERQLAEKLRTIIYS
ncbi:MAG: DNA primase [Saprospirales bacterium]|nr:MAG: DNA primase [Saprospirales bacterium]